MLIAVNLCFAELVPGVPVYYRLLLNHLVSSAPDLQFHFFTDQDFPFENAQPDNVEIVNIPPVSGKMPLRHYTWQRRLSKQVTASGPDLLINCNPFLNLAIPVPQVMILDDTAIELLTDGLRWQPRRALIRNLGLSENTLVPSEFDHERMLTVLRTRPSGIQVIGSASQLRTMELTWEQKQAVKERFTAGRDYFLLTPARLSSDHIINLLKAFSFFKRRQQSSLMLLLPAKIMDQLPGFEQKLATYKYREDVLILPKLSDDEQLELLAAAYGVIDPVDHLFSSAITFQAFETGVPIIVSHNSRGIELAGGEELLTANLEQPQELANQMMLLYKDEHLRNRLIATGSNRLGIHSWQNVVSKLKDALQAFIQDS